MLTTPICLSRQFLCLRIARQTYISFTIPGRKKTKKLKTEDREYFNEKSGKRKRDLKYILLGTRKSRRRER